MLVCVAASGERCCSADLLMLGLRLPSLALETAPWQRDTLLRHARMCLRARLRASGRPCRIVGLEHE